MKEDGDLWCFAAIFFENGDKTNFIVVLYAGYLLPLSIGLKQSNDGNNS